jgi:excisionase family DNA binding protein
MPITPHTKIEELPQFLTVEERRTFMGIGRSSAYDLIRQGILPVIRLGRTVRISREAVVRFIDDEGRGVYDNASDGQTEGANAKRAAQAKYSTTSSIDCEDNPRQHQPSGEGRDTPCLRAQRCFLITGSSLHQAQA